MIDRNCRFVLWIDSIATVLVCPQDEVWIGQAVPTAGVQLAFQANLNRRHAKISREDGGYWLQSEGRVEFSDSGNRQDLAGTTVMLRHEQKFELGSSVGLQFFRPHPLTSTAVLKYTLPQRTVPRTDFSILMAEACLLGRQTQDHIMIPELDQAALFFQQGQLHFRCKHLYKHSGATCNGVVAVADGSCIETEWFAMTIEKIEGTA